jgi:V8-like Glu-specific endopeptidase
MLFTDTNSYLFPIREDKMGTNHLNADSTHYPYTAVCEVVATFSDGTTEQGSGCFVSANDVLTASHMLWQTDHGGAATSVTVYPGADGGSHPFGAESGVQWHYYQVNDHNDQLYQSDSQYDTGLISLGVNEGNQTGWFGMDPNAWSGNYHLTGYPAIYGPDRMCDDYGYANHDANYMTYDYQSIESNPGNSGGPLWYQGADGNPYVVGVCSTTAWAADIYQTYDQLLAWIHSDASNAI